MVMGDFSRNGKPKRKGIHPWRFMKRRVYNRIRDRRGWRRYSAIEDLG